jgi:hypothetical protein
MGGGLNLKAAPTDIADNELQEAVGCRFDVTGAVSSERGRERIARPKWSNELKGIIDQYLNGDLTHLVKAGGKVYEVSGPFVSASIGNFAGSDNITGATYREYTYLSDGNKIKRWDGTTLEAVGLDAPDPGSPMTAASSSTAPGGVTAGTYKYWVSFYNGVAESNFYGPIEVTVNDGDDTVTLSNVPIGGSTVTARRVYRSDKSGQVKYFLAEIANNEDTTYTDEAEFPEGADDEDAVVEEEPTDEKSEVASITDIEVTRYQPNATIRGLFDPTVSESGEQSERAEAIMTQLGYLAEWTDHTPPPDDLKHLTFVKEQFFGISDNKVRFTRVGNPEYWPELNSFRPGRRAAEAVMTLASVDRDVVIFTDSNLYRLSSLGASFQATTVRLDQIDSPTGLAGEWAVADLMLGGQNSLIFYGKDGLYITDGRTTREVTWKIEQLFTNPDHPDFVDPSEASTVRMVSSKDRFWMSYNGGERTLFADFQNPQDPKFSVFPYGYTALTRDRKLGKIRAGDDRGFFYEIPTYGGVLDLGATEGAEPALAELSSAGGKERWRETEWRCTSKSFPIGSPMRSAHLREIILDIDTGNEPCRVTVELDTRKQVQATVRTYGRDQVGINLPYWMRGHYFKVTVECKSRWDRHWYGVGMEVEEEPVP